MNADNTLTSKAVLKDMGILVKEYRISRQLTQEDLANRSGVSVRSISRFEMGGDIQFGNFIKLLRALDLHQNLDLLIPDVTVSPAYYLRSASPKRYKRKSTDGAGRMFKWGDEA